MLRNQVRACMQTGDTSSYATSIGAVLHKWGGVLYRGLVPAGSGPDVDDAAFDHICSKLAARFIPYITSHGILKYAPPFPTF